MVKGNILHSRWQCLAAIFRIDRMNRGYIGADFRDFQIFVMIERFIKPQPFYFYLDAKKTF